MPASDPFVCLGPGPTGGLTVPVAALRLAWDLEERGFRLSQEGDTLYVEPARSLTEADRAGLRRWKHHVLALMDYEPPAVA